MPKLLNGNISPSFGHYHPQLVVLMATVGQQAPLLGEHIYKNRKNYIKMVPEKTNRTSNPII